MSTYSVAVMKLLDGLGIGPKDDFDRHVSKFTEYGERWVTTCGNKSFSGPRWEPTGVLSDFDQSLRDLLTDPKQFYSGTGIHQFGICPGAQVPDDSVKKSLFLSDLPTIFTDQELSFTYEQFDDWVPDGDSAHYETTFHVNAEFVRSLHNYRDAINRDSLVILPKCGEVSPPDSIKGLIGTKVVNFAVNPTLFDRIICEYRQGRQVAILPELQVPWIEKLPVESILAIREDSREELLRFQRAYHDAVQEHLQRYGQIDFGKTSKAIYDGIIAPAVANLEKKYQRILARHRSISALGVLSVVPITAAIVSEKVFHHALGDIQSMIAPTTAALIAAVARQRTERDHELTTLESNTYYLVWKVSKEMSC